MQDDIVVSVSELGKTYPNGTEAVKEVTFDLKRGEIHAIVGENGAGKSTVMKMLYGLERPTTGTIDVGGKTVAFNSPQDAIDLHIGLVHQHLMLLDSLSVAENIALGSEPVKGLFLNRQDMNAGVAEIAEKYGMAVDPAAIVGRLAVGLKQRIEILKALYKGAEILLLDEPTAVLTPQETRDLFKAIKGLTQLGMTVVFITHKLVEVKEVADRVTVMRDGKVMGQVNAADVTVADIAEMMVGRPVTYIPAPRKNPDVKSIVEARNLTLIGLDGRVRLNNVSFDIRPGEILGVAGVEGNGQAALGQVLIGLLPPAEGEASINGNTFTGRGVGAARSLGVANIPEDRIHDGIVADMSIEENFIAAEYANDAYSRSGFRKRAAVNAAAKAMIESFGVKTASEKTPIGALSGGNMQKVVLGREFSTNPKFLIAAQPTRGVDIGAAEGLRQQLVDLRDAGTAVLLVSADLEETIALSDRIMVLYKGEVVAHFNADQADENELGLYMLGAERQSDASACLSDRQEMSDV
ncbi:ABC transporter ATP-binding protein [Aliiroseovarius sp. 2305UL8-7]|uniref:ABC transporter ATP-binding protein n=1 Tax=Aliiroseovarius conchicola TaxID=3121637 RepID=UPI003527C06D